MSARCSMLVRPRRVAAANAYTLRTQSSSSSRELAPGLSSMSRANTSGSSTSSSRGLISTMS